MKYDEISKVKKTFELLEGKTFYFYGVVNNMFKLDELVFEALEDPDDGYRSSLGAILVREDTKLFHRLPIAKVIVDGINNGSMDKGGIDGHVLRDVDTNHIWLKIGTGDTDDYYPYFAFNYTPDRTQTAYLEVIPGYKSFEERYPELILKAPEWFNNEIDLEFKGY